MMICRKTMKQCATPSMCMPFQGCGTEIPDKSPADKLLEKEFSTVREKRSRPVAGQFWHVKMQGATALLTRLVTDVTPLTIELSEDRYSNKTRYRRMDIEMVERVK